MFNPRNESRIAKFFVEYREENNHLLTKLRREKTYFSRVKEFSDLEKDDVIGGIFSMNSHLEPLFDSIDLDSGRIVELLDLFIKCLEEEMKELEKYFSKLKQATTESQTRLESLLVNYNQKKYEYMEQLNTLVPGLIELADRAIGMEDETIGSTASKLEKSYKNLENALLNENMSADSLYIIFEDVLLKLKANSKYLGDFVKHDVSNNFKTFVSNFRSMKSLMIEFEEHRKNCGRDKDKEKLFTSGLDDDKKKKLHEFMKKRLEILFDGTEFDGEKKKANERITKIIEIPTTFGDEKKKYETNYKTLVKGKFAKLKYSIRNKAENLLFICDGLDEKISFEEFRKKHIDAKDIDKKKETGILEKVNLYLETLIESKDDKNPFKSFKKLNKDFNILENGGSEDDDDDGEKIKDKDWNEIKNAYISLSGIIAGGGDQDISKYCAILWDNLFKNIKKDGDKYKSSQLNKVLKYLKRDSETYEQMIQTLLDFAYKNEADLKSWNKDKWEEILIKLKFLF